MNKFIYKGNWNIAKGKVRQTLGRWIKNDLEFLDGKADEMVGRIQKRAGIAGKLDQNVDSIGKNAHGHV